MEGPHNSRVFTVSTSIIKQYRPVILKLGLDWQTIMAPAGLDEGWESKPYISLSENALGDIFRALARKDGADMFGLLCAKSVKPADYDLLGYMSMAAESVAQLADLICQYEGLIGNFGKSEVSVTPGEVTISWRCNVSNTVAREFLSDRVICCWLGYLRWLIGERVIPKRVTLVRHSLDENTRNSFQEFMGCALNLSSATNSLVFERKILDMRIPQSDPVLLEMLRRWAEERIEWGRNCNFIAQVRHAIITCLARSVARKPMVSAMLDMSPRTLDRRLGMEGISYQTLLDEIRAHIVTERIMATSTEELATMLGFTEPRSFNRWFKARYRASPSQVRRHSSSETGATDHGLGRV